MSKYEENMKKALMRGVCALNLEAMSIFNEDNLNNHQQNNHSISKKAFNLNQVKTNANYQQQKSDEGLLNQQKQNSNEVIITLVAAISRYPRNQRILAKISWLKILVIIEETFKLRKSPNNLCFFCCTYSK